MTSLPRPCRQTTLFLCVSSLRPYQNMCSAVGCKEARQKTEKVAVPCILLYKVDNRQFIVDTGEWTIVSGQ